MKLVRPGAGLTAELQDRIRKTLREKASPRHVPALILEAPDIPYTLNMKKVESAVTNHHERPARDEPGCVIKNPECLNYYEKILSKLQQ